nr:ribosomal protein S18 [Tanacetum cinerariifolium]
MEDFERSVFGDPSSSSFFKKLDLLKGVDERSAMNSRFNGSRRERLVDGLDDSFTSLTHGLDGKLKDVATYFEYGVNEVEKEDYKLRPDVTFWPGNTYDVKE